MKLTLFRAILGIFILTGSIQAAEVDDLRNEVTRRREAVASQIGNESLLILLSSKVKNKTADVDYEYRQNNNLYYLTGISQDDTTLVLMPGNSKRSAFLFVKDRNPKSEHWQGKILSHEEVTAISGIPNVYSSGDFPDFLDTILNHWPYDVKKYSDNPEYETFFSKLQSGQAMIYFSFNRSFSLNGEMSQEVKFANQLRERFYGFTIRDASPIIDQLRQVKSDYEIDMVQKAIRITEEGFRDAIRGIKPGVREFEIESVIEAAYKRNNSFDWGFPSIVASGSNATILHYESNQDQLKKGDLILMDLGAEYKFYGADVTRTFPIDGKFSPEQRAIYELVLEAQNAAMSIIKPGILISDVHNKSVEVIQQGLKRLGLITDSTGDQYKMYFTHGSSHWLGMDVHDVGSYLRKLEPGMIFTVEPGIYVQSNLLENLPATPENEKLKAAIRPAFEKYKNIGVRIEDDVVVTADGYKHLSNQVPRKVEEIEAAFSR